MAQLLPSEATSFTLDNSGRFLCNTLQEAIDSTAQTLAGRRRDFDVIVIGGGTFGAVIAEYLLITDATRSRRILILEAGPFVLPEHIQNLPYGAAPPSHSIRLAIGSEEERPGSCPPVRGAGRRSLA